MVAKEAKSAEPLTDAVAPVKMREGGWGDVVVPARRRGRVAWEKRKDPLLRVEMKVSRLSLHRHIASREICVVRSCFAYWL